MSYLWSQKLRFLSWQEAVLYGSTNITLLLIGAAFVYYLYAVARLKIAHIKGSSDLNLDVTHLGSYAVAPVTPNMARFIELGITISTKGLPSYIQSINLKTNSDPKQGLPKQKKGTLISPTPKTGLASDNWFNIETEISDCPQTIFVLFEVFCTMDALESQNLECLLEIVTTRGRRKKMKFLRGDI